MKRISKYKLDKKILFCLVIFFIISIISIISADSINHTVKGILFKQIIWIICGGVLIFLIMYVGINVIIKNIHILYIITNISLFILLAFGEPINNAKCWFKIPGVGTFQPSEFMKIVLIIGLSKIINNFDKKHRKITFKNEIKLISKVFAYISIPTILTFLQPDTGAVIMYIIIAAFLLFISKLRLRWFICFGATLVSIIAGILILYFFDINSFIKLLGADFFLRVERLTNWFSTSGLQLENGLTAIGSAGFFGTGFNNTPLYFPEAHTDFIFAVFASNYGFIGSFILISTILLFDIQIIEISLKSKRKLYKYILVGIIGVLLYQQIQNIAMTFGLLPITGITLPFISYGGSSLLSYMIMMGIIFSINNELIRYRN